MTCIASRAHAFSVTIPWRTFVEAAMLLVHANTHVDLQHRAAHWLIGNWHEGLPGFEPLFRESDGSGVAPWAEETYTLSGV